jgi:hypothetical protein
MKPFALAAAACALAGAAAAQPAGPPPPYNDTPAAYPWRNGAIEGPGPSVGVGGGGGGFEGGGGFGGGGDFGGYGYGAAGGMPGWVNGPPAPGYGGGGYGGFGGGGGGFGGGGFGGGGGGGFGGGGGGGGAPAIFPLPDNGAYAVGQNPDGSLVVIRYGPVWTSQIGPNGWAHRRYISYGLPMSGIWPFN